MTPENFDNLISAGKFEFYKADFCIIKKFCHCRERKFSISNRRGRLLARLFFIVLLNSNRNL